MRDSFSDSVDGITVFVAGGSTSSNGLLVGWIGISAQKNGVSLYGKWLAIAMQPGQFMVEIPTSPYWLSLECWLGATGGIACELTRTLDINQDGVAVNIVELSLIAACFGRSAPCGSDPRQFPGLCPGCATSRDLMGPNGQPDGVINIFDLTIAAQFFGKFDISQGRLFPP